MATKDLTKSQLKKLSEAGVIYESSPGKYKDMNNNPVKTITKSKKILSAEKKRLAGIQHYDKRMRDNFSKKAESYRIFDNRLEMDKKRISEIKKLKGSIH